LRIATAGSVDDGKSTLIGRLLYDSKSIFEDQLQAIKDFSATNRSHEFDYALVTDGLKSEREQGITIDVAYRYFSTPKRRFIIADTPGHEEYTRNMATGASTASLALMVIDVKNGVVTQTKRHLFISSLLGIKHFVVAVNKMDLVGYSEEEFTDIINEFTSFSDKLSIESIQFIPISALHGDNVIESSDNMQWYKGSPLLHYLENITISGWRNLIDFRFPVQYVNWGGDGFRGYCGNISSGVIRVGDIVKILPSGKKSRITRIITANGDSDYAFAPESVTLCLEDELDISRGDMIVRENNSAHISPSVEANIVWMDTNPLIPDRQYIIKHTTNTRNGRFSGIKYRFDPENFHRMEADKLHLNEIGKVQLDLLKPIYSDLYSQNRSTGCFIVIDPITNLTVGAGMISRCRCEDTHYESLENEGKTIWFSDSGEESGNARSYYQKMKTSYNACVYIDDEILSHGLNNDLTGNLSEYLRRVAHICKIMNQDGITVIINSRYSPDENFREIIGERYLVNPD